KRLERVPHVVTDDGRAEGCVSSGESFRSRDDVRAHAPVLDSKPLTDSTESCDHLVGNEDDVIAIADLANSGEVLRRRHLNAVCLHHRLGDHRGYQFGSLVNDLLLEQIRGDAVPLGYAASDWRPEADWRCDPGYCAADWLGGRSYAEPVAGRHR